MRHSPLTVRRELLAIVIALAALAAIAPNADAATALKLKPGHKLVLTNGKTVVAKAAGVSEVFGFVGLDGVIRWFPRGSRLMRETNGTIFVQTEGKLERLGISKVMTPPEPAKVVPGGGVTLSSPRQRVAPPEVVIGPNHKPVGALHPATINAAHEIVLTNGKRIVARGLGEHEIFGILGEAGVHWFPREAKLQRDDRGTFYLSSAGKVEELGRYKSTRAGGTDISAIENGVGTGTKELKVDGSEAILPPSHGVSHRYMPGPPKAVAPTQFPVNPGAVVAPTHVAGSRKVIPPTQTALLYPLRRKEHGPRVAQLQELLRRLVQEGTLIHPGQAGRANLLSEFQREQARQFYGAATTHLVRLFQKAHGLKPSGMVNASTASALNSAVHRFLSGNPR